MYNQSNSNRNVIIASDNNRSKTLLNKLFINKTNKIIPFNDLLSSAMFDYSNVLNYTHFFIPTLHLPLI